MTARALDGPRSDLERNGASEAGSPLTCAAPTRPDTGQWCFAVSRFLFSLHKTSVRHQCGHHPKKAWHLPAASEKGPRPCTAPLPLWEAATAPSPRPTSLATQTGTTVSFSWRLVWMMSLYRLMGGPSRPGEKSRVAPRSTQDPRLTQQLQTSLELRAE